MNFFINNKLLLLFTTNLFWTDKDLIFFTNKVNLYIVKLLMYYLNNKLIIVNNNLIHIVLPIIFNLFYVFYFCNIKKYQTLIIKSKIKILYFSDIVTLLENFSNTYNIESLKKLNFKQFLCQKYGINKKLSFFFCTYFGINPYIKLTNIIFNFYIKKLNIILKFFKFKLSINLHKYMINNINFFIKINIYKGYRLAKGYPSRGQRTHTNAYTSFLKVYTFLKTKYKLNANIS